MNSKHALRYNDTMPCRENSGAGKAGPALGSVLIGRIDRAEEPPAAATNSRGN